MGLFSSGATFDTIVLSIVSLINLIIGVLSVLAIVLFFIGLVRYIQESSDSRGHAEGKERIIWSLVALFVLFSIWGILALMTVAFFGGPSSNVTGATPSTTQSNFSPNTSAGGIY